MAKVSAIIQSKFLAPQLLMLERKPPSGSGWVHEVKYDGYRMQAHVTETGVTWFTRNGHDWSGRFPDLDIELAKLKPSTLDGELCVVDSRGHPDFSALRSALGFRQRGHVKGRLTFFVFDLLSEGIDDLRAYSLSVRKARLKCLLGDSRANLLRNVDGFNEDAAHLLESACRMGIEGIVSKRLDSPYRSGERNKAWIKVKCRPSQEVVIGGWETNGAKFKSLLAGVYDKGKLTYVGHLSTGFGQDALTSLVPRLKALEIGEPAFAAGGPPRKSSNIHWTEPRLVAAADIAEWTSAGKLRQASFKGLREDKSAKSVIRERPEA